MIDPDQSKRPILRWFFLPLYFYISYLGFRQVMFYLFIRNGPIPLGGFHDSVEIFRAISMLIGFFAPIILVFLRKEAFYGLGVKAFLDISIFIWSYTHQAGHFLIPLKTYVPQLSMLGTQVAVCVYCYGLLRRGILK